MVKNNYGVTFIEVLVSISLIVIVTAAVTQSVSQITKTEKNQENKIVIEAIENKLVAILSNPDVCTQNFNLSYPSFGSNLLDPNFRQQNIPITIYPADMYVSYPSYYVLNLSSGYGPGGGGQLNGYTITRLDLTYKSNASQSIALLELNYQLQENSTQKLYAPKSIPLWVEYDLNAIPQVTRCSGNTGDAYKGQAAVNAILCQTYGPKMNNGLNTNYFGEPLQYYIDQYGSCTYNYGVYWEYDYGSADLVTCPADTVLAQYCGANTDWANSLCPFPQANGTCLYTVPAATPGMPPFGGIPEPWQCNNTSNPYGATCTWAPGNTGTCYVACLRPG